MECKSVATKILISAFAFSFAFVLGVALAEEVEEIFGGQVRSENQTNFQTIEVNLDDLDSTADPGGELAYVSPYNMYKHKQYFGTYHGNIAATLYWSVVETTSSVFVSCSGNRMSGAKYAVNNIVIGDGNVRIWVYIDWPSNVELYCDYLIIN